MRISAMKNKWPSENIVVLFQIKSLKGYKDQK